jgi:hypothetical protein
MGKINFGEAFSNGWKLFSGSMVNLILGFLLTILLSVTIILAPIMYAGFIFMLLKAARGESVEIGDVFHGFSNFGRYFLGGLLAMGVAILGVLACGIGIIPVSGLLLFFFPLLVDKGYSGGEALGKCWEYFKTDWLMAILLSIVTGIISNAGSYVLGIGVLFTGPFAMAVAVAAYQDVFGANVVPAAQPAPAGGPAAPPPPIQ